MAQSANFSMVIFFLLTPKPKKNIHRWQSKVAGIFTTGRREKYLQNSQRQVGPTCLSAECPAQVSWAPFKYPLGPSLGQNNEPSTGVSKHKQGNRIPKHKNPINFHSSIVALTTFNMAMQLFTQNTSIHNTFHTNNNISIVHGHLTHWSAPTSAIYDVIKNSLSSAREPETDLHSNSRWTCVYVCVLRRRRLCTLDDLRRANRPPSLDVQSGIARQ